MGALGLETEPPKPSALGLETEPLNHPPSCAGVGCIFWVVGADLGFSHQLNSQTLNPQPQTLDPKQGGGGAARERERGRERGAQELLRHAPRCGRPGMLPMWLTTSSRVIRSHTSGVSYHASPEACPTRHMPHDVVDQVSRLRGLFAQGFVPRVAGNHDVVDQISRFGELFALSLLGVCTTRRRKPCATTWSTRYHVFAGYSLRGLYHASPETGPTRRFIR